MAGWCCFGSSCRAAGFEVERAKPRALSKKVSPKDTSTVWNSSASSLTMSATRPTGMSAGKTPSNPVVMTVSPGKTSCARGTSITSPFPTLPLMDTSRPACPFRPNRTLHWDSGCVRVNTKLSWAVVSTMRPAACPMDSTPAPGAAPSRPPRLRTIQGDPRHPGLRSTPALPDCQGSERRSLRDSSSARSRAFSSMMRALDASSFVQSRRSPAVFIHDPVMRIDQPDNAVRWWL